MNLQTTQTPLHLASGALTGSDGGDGQKMRFKARFVRAGRVRAAGNAPSSLVISEQALRTALEGGLFNGLPVFIDHAAPALAPSLRNMAGQTEAAHWNPETASVDGVVHFYETPAAQTACHLVRQLLSEDDPPDIGLSLVFWPEFDDASGEPETLNVARIRHIESLDLVFEPAADGRILQALSSLGIPPILTKKKGPMNIQDHLSQLHQSARPEETGSPAGQPAGLADWLEAAAVSSARILIQNSGLPPAAQERLLSYRYTHPGEVENAIQQEKTYLASLAETSVIQNHGSAPRSPQIQMGRSGGEQFQLAFEALLDGIKPPEGIRPLSGLREFYNLVSGDYELTGRFHAERVYLSNVNSATMAGMVADALNKRVVNQFAQYPRWWEPVAIEEDFATLQQVKWITLAGVGSLPTVLEGAPYTELDWDDKTETADFIKKGGYLGITLEAIDKDDTRRLRAAPQALALGAYLTLSKAVSELFTANSGSGATMSDASPLFSAAHANLGSLSLCAEAWASTRQAMRDQTEFTPAGGSAAALGTLTAPRFLLVPNELEHKALEILGGFASGSAAYTDNNIWAEGDSHTQRMRSARSRVIVVDLWTDANDWVAVCDPLLYPTIGVAYRYGRSPEVFSVANPTSGLMFTNDVMPVKVRYFFAAGVMDWRGMYKHIVA